jgi:high-affinity iron transporter
MNPDPFRRLTTLFFSGILACFCFHASAITNDDANRTFQSIIHNLEYVSVDYAGVIENGRIVDQAEYSEQQEIARNALTLLQTLPANPQKAQLVEQGRKLNDAVQRKADPQQINALCRDTIALLTSTYHVNNTPSVLPSIDEGRRLFQANCTGCHGATGHGDGPRAAELTPKPANFHDRERQQHRSLYALFNVISLGADGTAMRPFSQLSAEQRWALAFYISTFYATPEELNRGQTLWDNGAYHDQLGSLPRLTGAKPAAIRDALGKDAVAVLAYLRANPQELDEQTPAPLDIARAELAASLDAFRHGQTQQAYDRALSAYVNGFEKVEAPLRAADYNLRTEIERKMVTFRSKIKNGGGLIPLESDQRELLNLLDRADAAINTTTTSAAVNFFTSMVILLREGLEAILVLAAIISVLVKSERRDGLRYIHTGWIGALLLGILTWFVAAHFIAISGAQRELTEGVTALIAAGMLLYVGFWLHDKSQAVRWQRYVHNKLSTSLSSGAIWGLVFIAFISVYREVFESILFYQSLMLSLQPSQHRYILAGVAVAIVVLIILTLLIMRFSVRLPLRTFFSANMWLMFILAVVFAGKGVAALQEANTFPSNPINFFQVDVLGIYPNLESLGLQLILICTALAWHTFRHVKGSRRSALPDHNAGNHG